MRQAPGWALEVKARRAFNPLEWMRQVRKNGDSRNVAVIMRPDGAGPATLDEWPVFMPFAQFKKMAQLWNEGNGSEVMGKADGAE